MAVWTSVSALMNVCQLFFFVRRGEGFCKKNLKQRRKIKSRDYYLYSDSKVKRKYCKNYAVAVFVFPGPLCRLQNFVLNLMLLQLLPFRVIARNCQLTDLK